MKYLEPGEGYVAKIQKRRTELNQHCTALWSLGPHQALHRNRAVMPVTICLQCSLVCKTNTAYFCALEKSLFLVIISSSLWTKKEEGRLVALVSHDQGADITVVTYCFLLSLLLSSFTNRNDFTCFWSHSTYTYVSLIINLTHAKLSPSEISSLFFVLCLAISYRMRLRTFSGMCYK